MLMLWSIPCCFATHLSNCIFSINAFGVHGLCIYTISTVVKILGHWQTLSHTVICLGTTQQTLSHQWRHPVLAFSYHKSGYSAMRTEGQVSETPPSRVKSLSFLTFVYSFDQLNSFLFSRVESNSTCNEATSLVQVCCLYLLSNPIRL